MTRFVQADNAEERRYHPERTRYEVFADGVSVGFVKKVNHETNHVKRRLIYRTTHSYRWEYGLGLMDWETTRGKAAERLVERAAAKP